MEKIVLYCKSYSNDVHRAKKLFESIKKYNRDNIPFYISVPMSDIQLFKDVLGTDGYTLINDEQIDKAESSWLGQQIIKSQFHKINACENYLCVDSDVYFIQDFYKSDFMFDDDTPYTVCHEHKDFFADLEKFGIIQRLGFNPHESFVRDREKIKEVFKSQYKMIYDFGPGPTIWSCKVWKALEYNILDPNNMVFSDLLNISPSEFTWYGEYLLFSKTIPIYPKQPIVKAYHYKEQFEFDLNYMGSLEEIERVHAKYNFLGLAKQSNWDNG